MITPRHEALVDEYLADLAEAVAAVRADPGLRRQGEAAMYGMIASFPFRGMIRNEVLKMARKMYGPEGEMPGSSRL